MWRWHLFAMACGQEIDVIGVDYSLIALIKAKERVSGRVELCAADAGRLPFRSQSVDGALCFGVLQAVYDSERVVRNSPEWCVREATSGSTR